MREKGSLKRYHTKTVFHMGGEVQTRVMLYAPNKVSEALDQLALKQF